MRAEGAAGIFEILNAKEEAEHVVTSKVLWDERQRQRVVQEERARRNVQEADDEDDHCSTGACEGR